MYDIPRHWEEDRPCTWYELFGKYGGLSCMDCDKEITSFDQIVKRLCDETMTEISFSEEDIIPMVELVCLDCGAK